MVKRITKPQETPKPQETSETVSVTQAEPDPEKPPEVRRRFTVHQLVLRYAPALAALPSCQEAHDMALAAQFAKEAPELLQVAESIQRAIAKGERQVVVNLSEQSARYLRDVKQYTVEPTASIQRQVLQLQEVMKQHGKYPQANSEAELSALVAAGSHQIRW